MRTMAKNMIQMTLQLLSSLVIYTNAAHFPLKFQGHRAMRPHPSDDLAIIPLVEDPNPKYDPQPEDLDNIFLRTVLGRHFDSKYMSPTEPAPWDNGFIKHDRGDRDLGEAQSAIKTLMDTLTLPDGTKMKGKINRKVKKKLQKFLWSYTYCPVEYKWTDLGVRFWPRWIMQGSCVKTKRSCSIPSGMSCRPSQSSYLQILRWFCRGKPHPCKWIVMHHPIITKCSCGC
ncbi:unnamed protein product [Owenia fusiformis]|uniref:Uncharacterized protein n=1 Tax=Owenia fusiformis TaxID=6347 RepID=A0A8J1UPG3_OWEFU|nr:unnamed protein product [Owenia fusiformis]